MTETPYVTPILNANYLENMYMWNNQVYDSITSTGLYFPKITKVYYNLKTFKTQAKRNPDGSLVIDPETNKPIREKIDISPVLTTTIYFSDGSFTSVKNIDNELPIIDPTTGKTTYLAKEMGFIYALCKRFLATKYVNSSLDKTFQTQGFGRILNEYVSNAHDCQEIEATKLASKADAKAKTVAPNKDNNKKSRNHSLAEAANALYEVAEKLKNDLTELKSKNNEICYTTKSDEISYNN